MGLTLDGQNYFANNLITVSTLSGISVNEIITDPEKNILAYADAYAATKNLLNITANDIESQIPILIYLSELPQKTVGQNFASQTQLYGYLNFLTNFDYQQQYGFPLYSIDLEKIFGTENYAILSSTTVIVTNEN